ncbi:Ribosomal protein L13 [Aphelenchoides besseyi]|nr:Ribosomal protein L13 [Aphelenchoides besseyi]
MTSSNIDFDLEGERVKQIHVIEWNHLNLWKFYPMALATSWSVRCLLYPMSVVKSRLQLQKQNNVYRGTTHAFSSILRTEGFTALYRGFWVTLPQLSASFIYSSVYEKLRNVFTTHTNIRSDQLVSALAGGAASVCTQFIFVPTDIVAQYMMVHNQSTAFSGSTKSAVVLDILKSDNLKGRYTLGLRVIRAVYKADGLLGFYRGFFSSLIMYIPSSMVFWSSYYQSLIWLKQRRALHLTNGETRDLSTLPPADQKLLLWQAISGAIGGMSAAIITNPLEVMRIRIQIMSRFARVKQWSQFHRQWHVIDAAHQDYPRGKADIAAHQLHEYDPCRVAWLAIYKGIGKTGKRQHWTEFVHLFPDAEVPDFIRRNIGNQLEQVQTVARKSTDYTAEERARFPRLMKWNPEHPIDWRQPQPPLERYDGLNSLTFKRLFSIDARNYGTQPTELTESEFDRQAERLLHQLTDFFDQLPDRVRTHADYDVSYSMGVLTVVIDPNVGTYVINKQTPNRQIWLSSPKSGPKRYDWIDNKWVYAHDGVPLLELLESEFASTFSVDVLGIDKLDFEIGSKMIAARVYVQLRSLSTVPEMMTAWVCSEYKRPLQRRQVRVPDITAGNQILVKVQASSVNPIDVRMCDGYAQEFLEMLRSMEDCRPSKLVGSIPKPKLPSVEDLRSIPLPKMPTSAEDLRPDRLLRSIPLPKMPTSAEDLRPDRLLRSIPLPNMPSVDNLLNSTKPDNPNPTSEPPSKPLEGPVNPTPAPPGGIEPPSEPHDTPGVNNPNPHPKPPGTDPLLRPSGTPDHQQTRHYSSEKPGRLPLIPGRDFCGEVVRVGSDVRGIQIGDQLIGICPVQAQGSHAAYALTTDQCVAQKPQSVNSTEAASMIYTFATVWSSFQQARIPTRNATGLRFLIHGGSGGIGTTAIQILRALDLIRELGATAVDYNAADVRDQLTREAPFDVILDCAKSPLTEWSDQLLGTWRNCVHLSLVSPWMSNTDRYGVPLGTATTAVQLFFRNLKNFASGRLFYYAFFYPDREAMLKPIIDEVRPFTDLPAAYEKVGHEHTRGKLVLDFAGIH